MVQSALVFQHFMCPVYYCKQIYTWFADKLVGLDHPILLVVCAMDCNPIQSPSDPHLCACVGMVCNPGVQGTLCSFQWHQNE